MVTGPAPRRTAVRQAISSLLRLASGDAQDAQTLVDAGSTRNAAALLRSAITRLIEAVVASEQGYTGPAETHRIPEDNPLKARLLRLDTFPGLPPALRQGGRLAAPPSTKSLAASLRDLSLILDQLRQHFGVDPEGDGPARTADSLRPPPEKPAPPPPPLPEKPSPAASRRQEASDRPPRARPAARAATAPAPPAKRARPASKSVHQAAQSVERSQQGLSSGTFWSLVDRWELADVEALRLIGHKGGLTKKGTRPRFKLTEAEGEIVTAMRSLNETMDQLGLDSAQWLAAPLRPEPFRGATPVSVIRKRRLQGLREVSRYLTQMGLLQSLDET